MFKLTPRLLRQLLREKRRLHREQLREKKKKKHLRNRRRREKRLRHFLKKQEGRKEEVEVEKAVEAVEAEEAVEATERPKRRRPRKSSSRRQRARSSPRNEASKKRSREKRAQKGSHTTTASFITRQARTRKKETSNQKRRGKTHRQAREVIAIHSLSTIDRLKRSATTFPRPAPPYRRTIKPHVRNPSPAASHSSRRAAPRRRTCRSESTAWA